MDFLIAQNIWRAPICAPNNALLGIMSGLSATLFCVRSWGKAEADQERPKVRIYPIGHIRISRCSPSGLVLRNHRQDIPSRPRFAVSTKARPCIAMDIYGFPVGAGSGLSQVLTNTEAVFLDQGVGKRSRPTPA